MEVYIQQRHIDRGIRCSDTHCPIALAVKEKTHKQIKVTGYALRIKRGDQFIYYALPRTAVDFVKNFDSGSRRSVKPFHLIIKP